MANDDGRLFFYSVFGFGAGIYTFFKGFREFRKYRLLADTPEIPIRSIPMGLVQIRGQACGQETLLSPVTHTSCYFSKVVVEEWHSIKVILPLIGQQKLTACPTGPDRFRVDESETAGSPPLNEIHTQIH